MITIGLLKKRNVRYTMIGVGIAIIAIAGFVIYESTRIKIEFELNENVIEYGTEQESIEWLTMSTTNGNKVTVTELDTKIIGVVKTKFNVCLDDICKEFEKDVEIKDTQAPVISLKEETVTLKYGTDYDIKENIESVNDPVDGEIVFAVEAGENNYYTIEDTLDVSTAGDYTIAIKAVDKNGMESTKEYTVHVNEEVKEEPQEKPSGSDKPFTPPPTNNGTPPTSNNNPPSPPETCVANGQWKMISNSGVAYYAWEEADAYGYEQIYNENSPWYMYGYRVFTTMDICGTTGYTVGFF